MGVFFKTRPLRLALQKTLQEALSEERPRGVGLTELVKQKADELEGNVRGRVAWGRVITAVLITVLLVGGAVYTGQKPELSGLYAVLLHAVELYLGGVLGLITGEALSRG